MNTSSVSSIPSSITHTIIPKEKDILVADSIHKWNIENIYCFLKDETYKGYGLSSFFTIEKGKMKWFFKMHISHMLKKEIYIPNKRRRPNLSEEEKERQRVENEEPVLEFSYYVSHIEIEDDYKSYYERDHENKKDEDGEFINEEFFPHYLVVVNLKCTDKQNENIEPFNRVIKSTITPDSRRNDNPNQLHFYTKDRTPPSASGWISLRELENYESFQEFAQLTMQITIKEIPIENKIGARITSLQPSFLDQGQDSTSSQLHFESFLNLLISEDNTADATLILKTKEEEKEILSIPNSIPQTKQTRTEENLYKIKVHKSILSAMSPVFRAAFAVKEKEIHPEIEFDNMDYSTFIMLIHYMYGGKEVLRDFDILLFEWKNVLDLFIQAERYQIDSLILICIDLLTSRTLLTPDNFLFLIQFTQQSCYAHSVPMKQLSSSLLHHFQTWSKEEQKECFKFK